MDDNPAKTYHSVKICVAGTFSAEVVLSPDGIDSDKPMTKIKRILSEPESGTEPEPEYGTKPRPEPEPEPKPYPEPEPEPVPACKCGIELPKKIRIIGGQEVLRVGFS